MINEELQREIQELSETRRQAEQVASEFQAGVAANQELLEVLFRAADTAIKEKDRGLLHKITSRFRDFLAHPASLLSPEEQGQLRESIKRELLEFDGQETERTVLAQKICGKYAFVPGSSDAFTANKSEEIALEDRPR